MGQLIEETGRSDKDAMLVWWKEYNIMKAIRNIDEAWNEVSQSLDSFLQPKPK